MCNWVGMGECTSNSSQDEEGREALCTKIQRERAWKAVREKERDTGRSQASLGLNAHTAWLSFDFLLSEVSVE